MNIRNLQRCLEKIDEFRPIGRAAEVDGVKINVVGMARHENELQLIILQHNKALSKSIKERLVVHNLACNGESPGTSGWAHCPPRNIPLDNFMQTAMSIDIGNGDLRVKGTSTGRLDSNEWESAAMISYFLQNGWEPEGIGSENIEELYMTTFDIMGEHSRIPDFDEDSIIHFHMREECRSYLVNMPVELKVGNEEGERLYFKGMEPGEEHWIKIYSASLVDMWAQQQAIYEEHERQGVYTKEQLDQSRATFEKVVGPTYPRGMRTPVVEYACDEGIESVQFEAMEPERPTNCAVGFIIGGSSRSDGLQTHFASLMPTVPPDTTIIRAQITHYYKTFRRDDVIM